MRVPDRDELFDWHDLFRKRGYTVSRVKDRYFFHSLYVRDPGGILFELATETPGLRTGDINNLGDSLFLPPCLEEDREMINAQLQPLDTSARPNYCEEMGGSGREGKAPTPSRRRVHGRGVDL